MGGGFDKAPMEIATRMDRRLILCLGSALLAACAHDEASCSAPAACASMACLSDDLCVDEEAVAYVQPGGTGTACTQAEPCGTLRDGLAADRPYIKLVADGSPLVADEQTVIDRDVTIFGEPGVPLRRANRGGLLEIDAAVSVRLYDLALTGTRGSSPAIDIAADGAHLELTRVAVDDNEATGLFIGAAADVTVIDSRFANNGGSGISMTAEGAPSLAIIQSTFRDNAGLGVLVAAGSPATIVTQSRFSGNADGGLYLAGGSFDIVGNVFFANGSSHSTAGGLFVIATADTQDRLELNTLSGNRSPDGVGPAMTCVARRTAARNNLLSDNRAVTRPEQIAGSCTHAYTLVERGPVPEGVGNRAADPMFLDAAHGDLHLRPGSPARRAADPAADLTGLAARDLDGHARTAPADLGAFQVP